MTGPEAYPPETAASNGLPPVVRNVGLCTSELENPMDSLQKKRLRQRLLVAITSVILVIVVAISMMRPSEAEKEEAELAQTILAHRPGQLPQAERQQLREQWRRLPPESRDRLFRAIATARPASSSPPPNASSSANASPSRRPRRSSPTSSNSTRTSSPPANAPSSIP